jgi:hypothetical protein
VSDELIGGFYCPGFTLSNGKVGMVRNEKEGKETVRLEDASSSREWAKLLPGQRRKIDVLW